MQSLQIIFARNVYVVSEKLCGDSIRQNDNLLLFEKSLGRPVPAPPNSLYSLSVTLVIRANCSPSLGASHVAGTTLSSLQTLCSFETHHDLMNYLLNYYSYFTDKETEAKEIKYLAQGHSS